jgi:hypothetical protein
MTHPHDVLGIEPNATSEQIKKAFLKLARKAHPDAGGTKERFISLQDAYESMMQVAEGRSTDSMEDVDAADQKSYDAQVREVWETAEAYRPAPTESVEPKQTPVVWQALLVTPLSAAMIACCFGSDGRFVYPALWSFMFSAALVAIVWACGFAAVLGSSLVERNTLAVYNRFVLAVTILTVAVIAHPASGQSHWRDGSITQQFVPEWWPMRDVRWSLNSHPGGWQYP